MKLRDCGKFVFRQIYNRKWSFFFSICTISIAFFFMDSIMTENVSGYYNILQLKQLITDRTDSVIHISFENIPAETDAMDENISNYIRQLKMIHSIKSAGSYVYANDMWEELQTPDAYLPRYKTAEENPDYVQGAGVLQNLYYMDTDVSGLCNVYLTDGRTLQEAFSGIDKDTDNIPVLAGYNFRDIVGEGKVYHSALSGQTYRIIGFLEEESTWLSNDLFYTDNIAVSLDNVFLVPWKYENGSPFPNSIFGVLQNGNDYIEVKQQIQQLAAAQGLYVSVSTLEEKIKEFKQEQSQYLKFGLMICLIVVISVFLAVGTNVITSVLLQRNTYGIMLSFGVMYKDIFRIILFENMIRILLPYFMIHELRTMLIMKSSLGDIEYMGRIHTFIAPGLFFLAVVFCIFFSCTAYCMLKKQSPIELIRG